RCYLSLLRTVDRD
ncbi:C-terminal processing peptidase family protein, partial [Chlamydia psittaci 84-8471/1]